MERSHQEIRVLLGAIYGSTKDEITSTTGMCGAEKIEGMMRIIADLCLFKDNPLLIDHSPD